jgi:hypothetical protein
VANDQVEAVGAGAANGTDASVVADDTKAEKVGDAGVTVETPLLLSFSLTKHSTIFAEVKGCFGNINQLERFVGNGG